MSTSLLFTISVVFSITSLPFSFSADQFYEQCLSPLRCGGSNTTIFPNITYPFWGNDVNKPKYCGQSPFKLSCEDEETLAVKIDHHTLRVISTDLKNSTIIVADESLFEDRCPKIWNFSGTDYFSLNQFTEKIDLFNCSNGYPNNSLSTIACRPSDNGSRITYHVFGPLTNPDYGCVRIGDIPIFRTSKDELHQSKQGLKKALQQGFGLMYSLKDTSCQTCTKSQGICGSELKSENFRCLCQDKPHNVSCTDEQRTVKQVPVTGGTSSKNKKIIIAVGSVFVGLLIASIVCLVYHRKRIKLYKTSSALLQRNNSSNPSSKTFDVEKAEELLVGVRLFSYEELEEATDNFNPSKELGDGGFGTVYFGKLKDGRKVAVKRLYDNHLKRAEQFKNEVEILTGLRHPNLVTLFGCSSKQSRELLLVYEYVENGTLADHLHGSHANSGSLPWSIRLKIAVETASALKYLHASKIIHRDVKSNNILLDQNFNVKVADFGLSRLFPIERTHVSTAPQGTPGYVDPDYHLCYQLSNKSDVYSFAVVLMELISSLPAVDISRPRQEINLSNMALLKIQNHELHDMVDPSLGFDTDTRVREMVIAVAVLAFQCLQPDKDLRPCMTDVLDTLTMIQNNGFGSDLEVVGVDKSLIIQSPNTVFVKWDSK